MLVFKVQPVSFVITHARNDLSRPAMELITVISCCSCVFNLMQSYLLTQTLADCQVST